VEKNPTMIVVAAALLDRDGKILLQQRAQGRHMAGLWEFPGGKLEEQELPEEALVRELREELGIGVDARSLIPVTFASAKAGDSHMLLLLFLCREWSGTPQALDAAALKWLKPADMDGSEMPPADEPMIRVLVSLL